MLKLKDIYKKYNIDGKETFILKGVNIDLAQGDCALISGISGSGKSTLLNIIGTIARPSSGEVWLWDREISRSSDYFLTLLRREKIGFIFQQFNLISGLDLLTNVIIPLLPAGYSYADLSKKASQLLNNLGMGQRMKSRVNELSGGELQRVAIARALINDPELILADEPTSNVDDQTASLILNLFLDLKKRGKSIIIASHDPFWRRNPDFFQKNFVFKEPGILAKEG